MEDEGIRDIRSCIRVPGIYIVPWYSVTSGKTEIDSGSVALRKRWRILSEREFTYSRISIVSTKYDFCRSLQCSRKRIVALHVYV